MRSIILCFLLAGCASHEPLAPPVPRHCPTLPTLQPGDDLRQHISIIADIYARCAATQ